MKDIDIDEITETPFDRSYWADHEHLLAGCYPGDIDPAIARKKITYLLRYGIRHIINLMEDGERDKYYSEFAPYEDILKKAAVELKVEVTINRHPIKDFGIAPREFIKEILDEIDEKISEGKRVYVHCWGGIGRTGMIVGCYLVRHGYASGESVIDKIKELRANISNNFIASPESALQKEIVKSWKPGE
ncbi:MAG TPA: dual specificity protein phosphatase family protein [Candidatus Wallbacteria bacterium]|nr:dual specificity protein phosphatase family protein [Candidatus Wallbacteria bacterium]